MTSAVKIVFSMRTPMVVPSTRKHLDALLSWAAVQQAEFLGADDPIEHQHNIGLEKHSAEGHWCFKASAVDFAWIGESDQLHYIKRSRLEDYAGAWDAGLLKKRPYFDGARGSTKAGSYFQPLRWAREVSGHAVVDDMERLMELLPWVTHIGKLAHKDHGAVRGFTVTEDVHASKLWANRNLPLQSEFASGCPVAMGSLVSPYWKRSNHGPIAIGTARA